MARPRQLTHATILILLATTWFLLSLLATAVHALRPTPQAAAPTPVTLCIPRERDALLAIKARLIDPSNYLSSWRGEDDCCQWVGVKCSNRTGHVVKLQISYSTGNGIGGEINSSLLDLQHLKHLDLSSNDFGGKPIPEFIGSLKSLTHLLLSSSNFGGRIPPHLGNLSNLISLDLSYQLESCHSLDLAWVSNLRKLQHLNMSKVDLRTVVDWTHVVNMIPCLLRSNMFSGGIPDKLLGMKGLQYLDIASNNISGNIPSSLGNLVAMAHTPDEEGALFKIVTSRLRSFYRYTNAYTDSLLVVTKGAIPSGNQLRALDDQASIYIGNPNLCGLPVSRDCPGTEIPQRDPEDQHEGMSDVVSLYLGIGTGFVTGLWVVFCGLLFKRNWRIRCFSFSDRVYDWVFLQVALRWASLTRKNQ
ncbi:hypothetical protein QYE76_060760 [Lolium multiflorum]|uniref:Leucine-rich repeat-containing N-terminal plant-type domain-containing protein n=1 Tax=Lolium multiflorum TaxID=4521 RepID=A0AAD8S0M6_LOLMU|nr:hypothetical protein QYE76_060760 [Lolium multiflorum]